MTLFNKIDISAEFFAPRPTPLSLVRIYGSLDTDFQRLQFFRHFIGRIKIAPPSTAPTFGLSPNELNRYQRKIEGISLRMRLIRQAEARQIGLRKRPISLASSTLAERIAADIPPRVFADDDGTRCAARWACLFLREIAKEAPEHLTNNVVATLKDCQALPGKGPSRVIDDVASTLAAIAKTRPDLNGRIDAPAPVLPPKSRVLTLTA